MAILLGIETIFLGKISHAIITKEKHSESAFSIEIENITGTVKTNKMDIPNF